MWPAIFAAMRTYAPVVVFPFAFVIGVVGYNFESLVSDKYTPYPKSVLEKRAERKMSEPQEDFVVPKTIFDRHGNDGEKRS